MWTKYTSEDKYYRHLFVSESLPTAMTLHALVRHVQDVGNLGHFKVEKNGHIIELTTERPVDLADFNVSLLKQDKSPFKVVWHDSTEIDNTPFNVGDDVVVSGMISYGAHITGKKGRVCPFWQGRFVDGMKKPFVSYLSKEIGIDVSDIHVTRLPNAGRDNKVQLNNLLTIIVSGKVIDHGAASSLAYRSVGQRKSYGLGSLKCCHEVRYDG